MGVESRGGEGSKRVKVALEYATGSRCGSVGRWRGVARELAGYLGVALAVAVPAAGVYATQRWPWVWYGSRGNFELHRMRTLRMSPERVVFEEDPVRAARLLLQSPDPEMRDVSGTDPTAASDYMRVSEKWPLVAFSPAFFRVPSYVPGNKNALVFMHARTSPGGVRRAVWVEAARGRGARWSQGVGLRVSWHECDWPFFRYDSEHRCMNRGMMLPTSADAKVRLFAGQPDEADPARFTIRYEIDDVPGTIEGWLGADLTVTMRVLDGPAATTPPVGMHGPGHAK